MVEGRRRLDDKALAEVPTYKCFFCGVWPSRRTLADLKKAPRPLNLCYKCVETLLAARSDAFVCSFCAQAGRKTTAPMLTGGVHGAKICDKCVEELFRDLHARKGIYELDAEILGLKPPLPKKTFNVQANKVFYLGPFSEPFSSIYRSRVVPVAQAQGLVITRADEIYSTRPIVQDIWAGIFEAAIIVAEVTGRNANVMYEVGVAHTVGKPVILITQQLSDVPFDFRHYRCVEYNITERGFRRLTAGLTRTLAEWIRDRDRHQLSSRDGRLSNKAMKPTPAGSVKRRGLSPHR